MKFQPSMDAFGNLVHEERPTKVFLSLLDDVPIIYVILMTHLRQKLHEKFRRLFMFIEDIYKLATDLQEGV